MKQEEITAKIKELKITSDRCFKEAMKHHQKRNLIKAGRKFGESVAYKQWAFWLQEQLEKDMAKQAEAHFERK